jgi:hypothetical protein
MVPTVYEWAGGVEAFERLTELSVPWTDAIAAEALIVT